MEYLIYSHFNRFTGMYYLNYLFITTYNLYCKIYLIKISGIRPGIELSLWGPGGGTKVLFFIQTNISIY